MIKSSPRPAPFSLVRTLSQVNLRPDLQNLTWGINPLQVTLCAFIDGYADIISFDLFKVYCTMMTGNFINVAVAFGHADYFGVAYATLVIVSYLAGCYISLILMDIFKSNRRKSYMFCLPFQAFGLICVGVINQQSRWYRYSIVPLVFSFGMLNTWGNRLGYTPQMMTGNMQKLTEIAFSYFYFKTPLDKKEKADFYILTFIMIAYFSGALICSFILSMSALNSQQRPQVAALSLIFGVLLKLIVSKAYTVFDCDNTFFCCCCRDDGCPTSDHIFANSSLIHHLHSSSRHFHNHHHHQQQQEKYIHYTNPTTANTVIYNHHSMDKIDIETDNKMILCTIQDDRTELQLQPRHHQLQQHHHQLQPQPPPADPPVLLPQSYEFINKSVSTINTFQSSINHHNNNNNNDEDDDDDDGEYKTENDDGSNI